MAGDRGLVMAYLLDGEGGGQAVGWDVIHHWSPDQGLLWVHFDVTDPYSREWLTEESGLDEVPREALLAEDTRPRQVAGGDHLLMVLRGVNANPGAAPDDMVSLRLWTEPNRLITTWMRPLFSLYDVRDAIEKGEAPGTMGEFLVMLCDHLVYRISEVVHGVEEQVDGLEEQMLARGHAQLRADISGLRRQVIGLRRYLTPQRDAMGRLPAERVSWFSELDRLRLREIADRITRYAEDLDAMRERLAVTHEELLSRLSEQTNRRMYILSLAAALFLPLGFVTGLFGVNLGGIPGGDNPLAFLMLVVVLAVLVALQIWLFRHRKWF